MIKIVVFEKFQTETNKRLKWEAVGHAKGRKEAEERYIAKKDWAVLSKKNHLNSYTIMYRCTKVRKDGIQCASRMKTVVSKNATIAEVFKCGEHTHESIDTKTSDKVKETVLAWRQRGIQPSVIADLMALSTDNPPPKKRIQNIIKYHNVKTGNVANITMDKLYDSLKELLKNAAELDDEDEAYITNFNVSNAVNPSDPTKQKPSQNVRFFCTTKRLLKNISINQQLICSDATYKLNKDGVPLFLVGTIDAAKHFHMIGGGAITTETEVDFEFFFSSLKNAASDIGITFQPKYLLADGSRAQLNGFHKVFPEGKHLMCSVHVHRNITEKHLAGKAKEKLRAEFNHDFRSLQGSPNDKAFSNASKLFIEKWSEMNPELADYMDKQWLTGTFTTWYEGASHHKPSHNNALEATNGIVKDTHIRDRMPWFGFLIAVKKMFECYSNEYANNVAKQPIFEAPITRDMYARAAKMFEFEDKDKKKIHEKMITCARDASCPYQIFYIPSTTFTDEWDKTIIAKWKAMQFESFEKYAKFIAQVHRVTYYNEQLKRSKCSCITFGKEYMCAHIVFLAVLNGKETIPDGADKSIFKKKRGIGRPKKQK